MLAGHGWGDLTLTLSGILVSAESTVQDQPPEGPPQRDAAPVGSHCAPDDAPSGPSLPF